MGNTCKPMAVSFQCMTKFTTNKIKKKEAIVHLRFNKIILKVKKKKRKNLDRTQVQVKRKNHGPVLKIELPKQGAWV